MKNKKNNSKQIKDYLIFGLYVLCFVAMFVIRHNADKRRAEYKATNPPVTAMAPAVAPAVTPSFPADPVMTVTYQEFSQRFKAAPISLCKDIFGKTITITDLPAVSESGDDIKFTLGNLYTEDFFVSVSSVCYNPDTNSATGIVSSCHNGILLNAIYLSSNQELSQELAQQPQSSVYVHLSKSDSTKTISYKELIQKASADLGALNDLQNKIVTITDISLEKAGFEFTPDRINCWVESGSNSLALQLWEYNNTIPVISDLLNNHSFTGYFSLAILPDERTRAAGFADIIIGLSNKPSSEVKDLARLAKVSRITDIGIEGMDSREPYLNTTYKNEQIGLSLSFNRFIERCAADPKGFRESLEGLSKNGKDLEITGLPSPAITCCNDVYVISFTGTSAGKKVRVWGRLRMNDARSAFIQPFVGYHPNNNSMIITGISSRDSFSEDKMQYNFLSGGKEFSIQVHIG